MDEELKRYLDVKFADLGAKFATKQDLERVEKNLLTELHKWASPSQARTRSHTATLRAIDLELETLADRARKLEGRAN